MIFKKNMGLEFWYNDEMRCVEIEEVGPQGNWIRCSCYNPESGAFLGYKTFKASKMSELKELRYLPQVR